MKWWLEHARRRLIFVYIVFCGPFGFYFLVEGVQVARLKSQPAAPAVVMTVQPWRNWAGWEKTWARVRFDDGREAFGNVSSRIAGQRGQRVSAHWSGRTGDSIYVHDPNVLSPWTLAAILWLLPWPFFWAYPYFKASIEHLDAQDRKRIHGY